MTPTAEQLQSFVGKVIRESRPFVRLLSAPTYYEEECVPGITIGEWRALANCDGALCVIAVNIREIAE